VKQLAAELAERKPTWVVLSRSEELKNHFYAFQPDELTRVLISLMKQLRMH
jgi:hypothetical protein